MEDPFYNIKSIFEQIKILKLHPHVCIVRRPRQSTGCIIFLSGFQPFKPPSPPNFSKCVNILPYTSSGQCKIILNAMDKSVSTSVLNKWRSRHNCNSCKMASNSDPSVERLNEEFFQQNPPKNPYSNQGCAWVGFTRQPTHF